jgi:hypothetical protein
MTIITAGISVGTSVGSNNQDNHMNPKYLNRLGAALSLFALLPLTGLADTDVVVFRNGDKLTGEVKSLERGKMRFDHDATGVISIEWDDVAFLSSDQNIQAETTSGTRYFGNLSMSEDQDEIIVDTRRGPIVLQRERVVKMNPIDQETWRDIDIDLSVGYNFQNANSVKQFNVGLSASQRTRTRIMSASFSSVLSDSADSDTSERQNLGFNFTRLRANRWLNTGNLTFDRNDELNLNLRTSLGGGIGRIMRQTDHSFVVLEGGLKVTNENLVNEPEDVLSLESYGQMAWDWYRFDTPELDLSTSVEIIPSITEWGRIRSEIDVALKWEIVNDLKWQIEVYDSFDNRPQTEGASNNDYGIITSLAYDF